ncbi:MAG TPA: hypothetical protein PKL13_00325 [bacterium]|nr:hypothetical protein [bacterium]
MKVYPGLSQTSPRVICPVCGVVLDDGGTKTQSETTEVCSECKKKQTEKIPRVSLAPESNKNI